jgi:hypothetical protein
MISASGEVCPGEGDHVGVKVFPRAGVALNADVAKASDPEVPLVEAVVAVSLTSFLLASLTLIVRHCFPSDLLRRLRW